MKPITGRIFFVKDKNGDFIRNATRCKRIIQRGNYNDLHPDLFGEFQGVMQIILVRNGEEVDRLDA